MRLERQAGFTLLEILVALVVLGFLLAGLSQGVRFGLRAWTQQAQMVDTQGDSDAVDRVLRRLIEQADPGRATVAAQMSGGPATVRMVTRLSPDMDRDAEVAIGVDAGKHLMLRWRPTMHATPLAPRPVLQEIKLLDGVDHIEFAYWGRPPGQAEGPHAWHSTWDAPDLPDLIRIRLVFVAGDSRHWPAIVAAPMRGKPG